jgi:hypothetical protein
MVIKLGRAHNYGRQHQAQLKRSLDASKSTTFLPAVPHPGRLSCAPSPLCSALVGRFRDKHVLQIIRTPSLIRQRTERTAPFRAHN